MHCCCRQRIALKQVEPACKPVLRHPGRERERPYVLPIRDMAVINGLKIFLLATMVVTPYNNWGHFLPQQQQEPDSIPTVWVCVAFSQKCIWSCRRRERRAGAMYCLGDTSHFEAMYTNQKPPRELSPDNFSLSRAKLHSKLEAGEGVHSAIFFFGCACFVLFLI